jgi:beta-glucanase (GH16 family)
MKIWTWLQRHYPKIIGGLLVAFLIGFWLYLQSQRIDLKGYTLSFSEEFEGSELSESWTPQGDGSFRYVGFYSDQQVSVRDGRLVINLAYRDGQKGQQLYGSEVQSTFTIQRGYVEVKAKLPTSNTINAVIALTTANALSTADPTQGSKIVFASTQHYPYPLQALGIYNALRAPETENAVVLSAVYGEFHTYGLLWTEERYVFYFDGFKVWESEKTPTSTVDQLLSFAFEFPYYTREDVTQLNLDLEIDSVKVYTQP